MAIPTVTAKDLHVVQLDPKLRKILAARARRASQRKFAPILAADRGAFGAANNEYQTQAQSVKGAAGMVEGVLGQALKGLQGSGLKGGYLRQVQNEITSRQGDAASSIPFLLADAAKERAKAIGEARTQLVGDRAKMLSGSAAGFNQLLKESRDAGSATLKAREGKEGQNKYDSVALSNARLALKDALTEWAKNPMVENEAHEEVRLQSLNPLKSKADWLKFAAGLEKHYDGFGLSEINHVIQQLLKRRQEEQEQHDSPVATAGREINPFNG